MQTQRALPLSCDTTFTPERGGALDPTSPWLAVSFGQHTFDAEGLEAAGRFFSRAMHWPGGASGVTIGRGYDMGGRTQSQIRSELTLAGLDAAGAEQLSRAAGLRGASADAFFQRERCSAPVLSLEVQHSLFQRVTLPETIRDIQRILSKPDVVSTYGRVEWDTLPRPAQEILFDLRYRGDYTPGSREVLQPLLVRGDWAGLADAIQDEGFWRGRGVPAGRISARSALAEELRSAVRDESTRQEA